LQHCRAEDGVEQTFKFRVLECKRREWVVIEWEPLPRPEEKGAAP
jgi:hypothetical protein